MKLKTIIMGLVALVCANEVNAQQLVTKATEGGIYPIAGSLTNDGKGRLFIAESVMEDGDIAYAKCTIYNTNMQEEATGIIYPQVFETKYGRLIAKTGIKVTDVVTLIDTYSYSEISVEKAKEYYNIDPSTLDGLKEFVKKSNGTDSIKVFTDAQGRTAVTVDYPYYYFDYERFGSTFVSRYYTVEGADVLRVECYYNADMWRALEKLDPTTLSWEIDNTYEIEVDEETNAIIGAEITSIDNGDNNVDVKATYATQNLFNSDNKWEYIMTAYDAAYPMAEENLNNSSIDVSGISDDGYITVQKYGNLPGRTVPNCLKIMQFDGTCIATFPLSSFGREYEDDYLEIYVIGGKPYFCTEEYDRNNGMYYSCLYNFNPATRQFNIVRKAPVSVKKVTPANRQIVTTKTHNGIIRNFKK